MFDEMYFMQIKVSLKALEKCTLNAYQGSMIRGAMGHALRKVSCLSGKEECTGCIMASSCPYGNVFFNVGGKKPELFQDIDTLPNPFIVYVPAPERFYEKGDLLDFRLTLFGSASGYLPYFIYAFNEMGKKGLGSDRKKFQLHEVVDETSGHMIADSSSLFLKNAACFSLEYTGRQCGEVEIIFDTPLRIKTDGSFAGQVPFELLIKNLLRRASLCCECFTGNKSEADYKSLLENAKNVKTVSIDMEWQPLERFSAHMHKKMSIGGLVGKVVYKGDLTEFMPLLKLGEIIHVGKSCTMGLGHYSILEK